MSSLALELLRRIFKLRTELCYQICRQWWKTEWLKNIAVINEQYCYHSNLAWHGYMSGGLADFNRCVAYNYRDLESPQEWECNKFLNKLHVYRCDRYNSDVSGRANFPMMHYFYSLRPEFECEDWFRRFLQSKSI